MYITTVQFMQKNNGFIHPIFLKPPDTIETATS